MELCTRKNPSGDLKKEDVMTWAWRHPSQVCMTYAVHWKLSMWVAFQFAFAAGQAIVHAFVPDLCVQTSTHALERIGARLAQAGCKKE